ncbi:MAG: ECF-type sigma factor [Blastocatellia bacterium]
MTSSPQEITQWLVAWSDGDKAALDKLMPLVYTELHRIAKRYMEHENPGHTLQTTALINEAYLRLVDQSEAQWQNRAHFFGVAARVMRHILVDYARARHRIKHGGEMQQVSLEEAAAITNFSPCWAPAGWARSTAPGTPSSTVRWRSRSYRSI